MSYWVISTLFKNIDYISYRTRSWYEVNRATWFLYANIIYFYFNIEYEKKILPEKARFFISSMCILGIFISSIAFTIGNIEVLKDEIKKASNYGIFAIVLSVSYVFLEH